MRWAITSLLMTAVIVSLGGVNTPAHIAFEELIFSYFFSAVGHLVAAIVLGLPVYLTLRLCHFTGLLPLVATGFLMVWVFDAAPGVYAFYSQPLPEVMYFNNHYIVFGGKVQSNGALWLVTGLSKQAISGAVAGLVFWVLTKGKRALLARDSGSDKWMRMLWC